MQSWGGILHHHLHRRGVLVPALNIQHEPLAVKRSLVDLALALLSIVGKGPAGMDKKQGTDREHVSNYRRNEDAFGNFASASKYDATVHFDGLYIDSVS
jgi:hypothetical protein